MKSSAFFQGVIIGCLVALFLIAAVAVAYRMGFVSGLNHFAAGVRP